MVKLAVRDSLAFYTAFNFKRNYRNVFGSNCLRYHCICNITITEVLFSSLNPWKTTERDMQDARYRRWGWEEGRGIITSFQSCREFTLDALWARLLFTTHTQTYVNNKNKTFSIVVHYSKLGHRRRSGHVLAVVFRLHE